MDSLQNVPVAELDLGSCSSNSIADRINAVPGLKTSTGMHLVFLFFSLSLAFDRVLLFHFVTATVKLGDNVGLDYL
jgi:hypothetical protein